MRCSAPTYAGSAVAVLTRQQEFDIGLRIESAGGTALATKAKAELIAANLRLVVSSPNVT